MWVESALTLRRLVQKIDKGNSVLYNAKILLNFNVFIFTGSCSASCAVGETGSGKSTCLTLMHKLIGGTFTSHLSGESISPNLLKARFQ